MLQILINFISNSMKFTNKNGSIKVHLKVLEEQSLDIEIERQPTDKSESPITSKRIIRRSGSLSNNSSHKLLSQQPNEIEVAKYIKMQMTIEDSGVGISKTNISKLFGNYARLDEHQTMNHKGTGLGLSICKKIVEQMGGNVRVESEIGVGTKFHIEIALKSIDRIYSPMSSCAEYPNDSPFLLNFTDNFNQHFKR